ncbi:MAG TPA: sigma-70 family RNA polymerase sigma factor [Thermoanaerobaculia bacterium]|nr:sigma-70 family RNA polymerase sigma factor [Thermoanaerobaculia bacterium]
MNPEETYLDNLRTIERIAAFVARRSHLNGDECAEFTQEVRVRLLEDDYAVIRKFEGRSSFSTYLTTVILRLFQQWRVQQWGKWRPSAEAKRLGEKAITLERLLTRDGFTFEEAVKVLTTPAGAQYTAAELEAIYIRLPLRNPRPVLVSDELLPDAVAVEADADDRLESRDQERTARRAASTIDGLLDSMDAEDRLILQMRFWDALKVPEIARTLHIEQKKLYKRLDKLFGTLRRGLESAGLSKREVGNLLSRGDQDIHVAAFPRREIPTIGPSHPTGGSREHEGEGMLR